MSAQSSEIDDYFKNLAEKRPDFLMRNGFDGAEISSIGEDCAYRRYFRAVKDGRKAVLMESLTDDHPSATKGHKLGDYIKIGQFLSAHHVHVPRIMDQDAARGFLLLEDMGDLSFKKAVEKNHISPFCAYEMATDLLVHIRDHCDAGDMNLPHYYDSHVHEGRVRVVDTYMPMVTGREIQKSEIISYINAWTQVESVLPPCPQGFLHIDYHFENLMFIGQEQGALAQTGLLDFQGAMKGPLPYDLVNLLEDARVDVPVDIQSAMIERFCMGISREDKEIFSAWYRVLGTQFHCRVIGQFIALARKGKGRYLSHIPRLQAYINQALDDPILWPLKNWFKGAGLDFSQPFEYRIDA